MNLQKKILIVININNVIDIITNSSSELFVLKGEEQSIVEEMISDIYPNYLNEYESLKDIRNMSNDEIQDFLEWELGPYNRWNARTPQTQPNQYKLLPGFSLDDLYDTSKIKWYNSYDLKDDLITTENRNLIIEGIEKTVGRFFLYSIDENPDWDYQEKLMDVGTRYHLG
jgi:hypothetical protein